MSDINEFIDKSNPDSNLLRRSSFSLGRLDVTWNMPFTDPVTYAMKCKGGSIFEQGIVIGNNNALIQGSLSYNINNDTFNIRKSDGWHIVNTILKDNITENSIATFNSNGTLISSNVILDGSDMYGLNSIETSAVISPDNSSLQLDNFILPESVGASGQNMAVSGNGHFYFKDDNRVIDPFILASYTVENAPGASDNTGGIIYCTNGNGGSPCLAVSDGTGWKRIALGSNISLI
jgi:hypothetical protein